MEILVKVYQDGHANARVLNGSLPESPALRDSNATRFNAGPPQQPPPEKMVEVEEIDSINGGAAPEEAEISVALATSEDSASQRLHESARDAGAAPTVIDELPATQERPTLRVIE